MRTEGLLLESQLQKQERNSRKQRKAFLFQLFSRRSAVGIIALLQDQVLDRQPHNLIPE